MGGGVRVGVMGGATVGRAMCRWGGWAVGGPFGRVPHAAVQLELRETRDLDAELRHMAGLAVDVGPNHLGLGDRQSLHERLGLGGKHHGTVDPLAVGWHIAAGGR